jgi:hypothetical protein
MKVFKRKRCPANQALLDHLRDEQHIYKICARSMEKMKGTLNFAKCNGYVDGLLRTTELEISEEEGFDEKDVL